MNLIYILDFNILYNFVFTDDLEYNVKFMTYVIFYVINIILK